MGHTKSLGRGGGLASLIPSIKKGMFLMHWCGVLTLHALPSWVLGCLAGSLLAAALGIFVQGNCHEPHMIVSFFPGGLAVKSLLSESISQMRK